MGSVLISIALLCHLGTGDAYLKYVADAQKKCQKELAECVVKNSIQPKPVEIEVVLLRCIAK